MNNREWLRTGSQLMILSLIAEKDCYGYEIVKEMEERSEHVFSLKEGTLYPLLHRLEKLNYIHSYSQTTPQNKIRKYYAITPKGLRQLQEEVENWQTFASSVKRVTRLELEY